MRYLRAAKYLWLVSIGCQLRLRGSSSVAHPVRLAKRAVYKHLHTFPAPLYGNELVNRLPTLRKYPLVIKHPENASPYIEHIYNFFFWH